MVWPFAEKMFRYPNAEIWEVSYGRFQERSRKAEEILGDHIVGYGGNILDRT